MPSANFKPPHFFRRMPDNESVLAKGGHGLLAGRIGNRQNGEIENCSGRAAMFHAPNTVVSLGMSEHPRISPVLQGMGAGFKTPRSGS
jgi:hypothetical protein